MMAATVGLGVIQQFADVSKLMKTREYKLLFTGFWITFGV